MTALTCLLWAFLATFPFVLAQAYDTQPLFLNTTLSLDTSCYLFIAHWTLLREHFTL